MSNNNEHHQRYRIKSVATITGLSTHALRKWEERYDLIQPIRSENGYRTFSEEDVQLLLFITTKLKDGESIGQVAQAGSALLREAMQQVPANLSLIPSVYQTDTQELLQAAREQNINGINQKFDHWIRSIGLQEAIVKVIFPLLQLIGDLWHQGGISISGEHCVSQLVRQYLLTAIKQERSPDKAPAIVACVPGDYHEIPPLTATFFLQQLGWQGTYLGPNVSFDILQTALHRKLPQLMILSCMMEPAEDTVHNWVQHIIRDIQPQCVVAVGGVGLSSYLGLFKEHGIPYLQKIQDVNLFTPNSRMPNSVNMRFIPSSIA